MRNTISKQFPHYSFVNIIAKGIYGPLVGVADNRQRAEPDVIDYVVKTYQKRYKEAAECEYAMASHITKLTLKNNVRLIEKSANHSHKKLDLT